MLVEVKTIKELIIKYKLQIICVLGGLALFIVASIIQPGAPQSITSIERAGYDSANTEKLYVEGLEVEPVLMDISVEARRFGEDEIDDAMERCVDEMSTVILRDNKSLGEIYYDMDLVETMSDYGFKVTWYPEDRNIIQSNGVVKNEEIKEPVGTVLSAEITDGTYTERYAFPITVMPRKYTNEELTLKGFLKEVSEADKSAATEPSVILPSSLDGRTISYKDSEERNYNFIWILGIVFAVLLFLRDKENGKKEEEKRFKQMQLDYPEIVSKLMVFVGAGMSVRMAWDAVARDYENSWARLEGTPLRRYAYEELCKTNARIKTGVSEGIAYREFGKECRSKQYMKLASLLEQNRRSGVANMKALLETEMIEAWSERKNLALRLGEEASTKLMIPLFMMLGIVMVIIMVPAMMSF